MIDFHNTIAPTAELLADSFVSVLKNILGDSSKEAASELYKYYYHSLGTPLDRQVWEGMKMLETPVSEDEARRLSNFVWQDFLEKKIVPYPEVNEELQRLRKLGWKIYMSTDNPQQVADKLAEKTGFRNLFDGVLGKPEEVKEHKVPYHVSIVAKQLNIPKSKWCNHFVYYGDSTGEMKAAKELGITGIARRSTKTRKELKEAGAKGIIYSKGIFAKPFYRIHLR